MSSEWKEAFLKDINNKKSEVEQTISEQKEAIEKYKTVGKTLSEYVKKLEAPISAKICDVAYFCDAHVVKTNEVMVNLGDDYLVECSSYTANKIIQRRIADCQNTIQKSDEFVKMLYDKLSYTSQLFGEPENKEEVEICEPYSEEKEKEFYENRRLRKEKSHIPSEATHESAMKRLEELEKLELENAEVELKSEEEIIESYSEEEDEEEEEDDKENLLKMLQLPGVNEKDLNKLIKFLETCDETSSDEDEEEEEEDEIDSDDYEENDVVVEKIEEMKEVPVEKVVVEEVKTKKKKSLKFAKDLEKIKLFRQSDLIDTETSTPEIETKSILKVTEPTPIAPGALEKKEMSVMSECTFPGTIVERSDPIYCMPSTSKDETIPEQPAKVSKFRQRRQAR